MKAFTFDYIENKANIEMINSKEEFLEKYKDDLIVKELNKDIYHIIDGLEVVFSMTFDYEDYKLLLWYMMEVDELPAYDSDHQKILDIIDKIK